jgi:hypothetical protein
MLTIGREAPYQHNAHKLEQVSKGNYGMKLRDALIIGASALTISTAPALAQSDFAFDPIAGVFRPVPAQAANSAPLAATRAPVGMKLRSP